MRRPLLVSLIVLGTIVTAIGGVGVFAPFTDRATTGVNTVTSGERPRAADLKLAYPVTSAGACATASYGDTLTTPGITLSNAQPGDEARGHFCLRNAGSASLTVSLTVVDIVDTDHACTGDEAAAGDATCGGEQVGELSQVLAVRWEQLPCDGSPPTSFLNNGQWLSPAPTWEMGVLAPGGSLCGYAEVDYGLNRTVDEVLRAQSDTLTFRWAFDGTT